MNKVLVDGIRGSSMWFFHKSQFRERISSDNTNEVLWNAPNSQLFIDSDSEKGQFEPSLTAKLLMAYFSACRKWWTQYNKTFIESRSSRRHGAKLLGEIEGQTEAHTHTYTHTPSNSISPNPSYFIPLTGSFIMWNALWFFIWIIVLFDR
jgi:hypothetical protein